MYLLDSGMLPTRSVFLNQVMLCTASCQVQNVTNERKHVNRKFVGTLFTYENKLFAVVANRKLCNYILSKIILEVKVLCKSNKGWR